MSSTRTSLEDLKKTIDSYLRRYEILDDDPRWELRISKLGEYGVFAKRDLQIGEIVFKDRAVILGPRYFNSQEFCVICFDRRNLKRCENCTLPICSDCSSNFGHKNECILINNLSKNTNDLSREFEKELFKCLYPLRSLLLQNEDKEVVRSLKAHKGRQHGFEVEVLKKLQFSFFTEDEDFMIQSCGAMDTNGFQLDVGKYGNETTLKGLYPLASLANHSCIPNITHVFDENQMMVARAAVFILKDAELFHSYTRIIWGTSTRLYHLLKTKHFICKCERCLDPTEFGTYMNSVLCKICKGIVIPVNPLKPKGRWQCEDCKLVIPGKEAEDLLTLLSSVLKGFNDGVDIEIMVKYLRGKLSFMAPENNQIAVETKLKIIWTLGHEEQYKWHDLTETQLELKKEMCVDVLKLLEKLKTGYCKLRGLLLYELFCTERELNKRDIVVKEKNNNISNTKVLRTYLEEAADILLYDVTAPEEIKETWKSIL